MTPKLRIKKPFFDIGAYISPSFESKFKIDGKKSGLAESEKLLVYWLTFAYENLLQKKVRMTSFRDLRTSVFIAASFPSSLTKPLSILLRVFSEEI